MAEIIVTSTADSGAGSLRQAIADASDGDVILFDRDVFPVGETTSILLSSYLTINKSVSIYGGFNDGAGGYTSGATKRYYVYREVESVKTKVYIDDENPAQEGETVLFENVCRVALDGQNASRHLVLDGVSVVAVAGIDFKDGSFTGSGASINSKSTGNRTIIDCNFKNCTATAYGGAFIFSDASINVLNNCYITSCSSVVGGAIRADGSSLNTLNNCTISDCSATSNGGGVYSSSTSQNTLNNCVISGCSATNNGGGVYSTSTSQNTLNDCVFDGCSATNGGSVYFAGSSQNTLNDCVFDGCSATTNGGGLYSASTSQNTLTDCNISNCSATNGGGLRAADTSKNTLNGCVISGCISTTGGGVYSNNTSQNTLNDCTITDCSASSGGGVYSANTSQNTLNDCTISGCSATSGGGVYSAGTSQNTLTNCTISGCSATANGGGFLSISTSANTLNDCTITNCSAKNGGGAEFADKSAAVLNNCIVSNCSAISNGGGLFIYNTPQVTLNACIFDLTSSVYFVSSAFITVAGGITEITRLNRATTATSEVITIADGAALTITDTATIGAATFTSDGRGYLAVGAGINTSAATLTNVVLCAYGADVSSFAEVDGVLEWEAANPTTTVLIERADGDSWSTVAQPTGESLTLYLPPSDTVRLFDGVQFFTAQAPSQRTYYYIGGAEGSFTSAADWSLRRGGVAITEPPVVAGQRFIVGDIAEEEQGS